MVLMVLATGSYLPPGERGTSHQIHLSWHYNMCKNDVSKIMGTKTDQPPVKTQGVPDFLKIILFGFRWFDHEKPCRNYVRVSYTKTHQVASQRKKNIPFQCQNKWHAHIQLMDECECRNGNNQDKFKYKCKRKYAWTYEYTNTTTTIKILIEEHFVQATFWMRSPLRVAWQLSRTQQLAARGIWEKSHCCFFLSDTAVMIDHYLIVHIPMMMIPYHPCMVYLPTFGWFLW